MNYFQNRGAAHRMEHQLLLRFSGLGPRDFRSRDVAVGPYQQLHFTEAGHTGQPKPKLLLLHGLGGNNAVFYKMLAPLARRFHVVSLDLPGMGFNTRFRQPFDSAEGCLDFMVGGVAQFAQAIGWREFAVVGHSMGGYFASHLFDRHAAQVSWLCLVSPIGFNPALEDSKRRAQERLAQVPAPWRFLITRGLESIWEHKKSPFELTTRLVRNYIVGKYYGHRRFRLPKEELDLLIPLTRHWINQPQSGERCLAYVMRYGLTSPLPVLDVLRRHRDRARDVVLVYGENDWMDKKESLESLEREKLPVASFYVPDCDHQIPFQNPADLCDLIVGLYDSHLAEKAKRASATDPPGSPNS